MPRRGGGPASSAPPGWTWRLPLYEAFLDAMRAHGVEVASGRFAADMQVELVNDGPVTLILDTP